MPRLILALRPGARTASVRQQALQQAGVSDAVEARVANAVIVEVDQLTADVRERLAALPNVARVDDDIQATPQVADEQATQDFLNRVRDLRGEEHVPPLIETEPVRRDDVRTDGGRQVGPTVALDAPPADPSPQATIANIDDSISVGGGAVLHEQGFDGASVICANLDTGACGDAIRSARQLEGADLSGEDDPWTQLGPHGPYTLGIMAGDATTPGIDVGYALASDVFPIKSTLASSEIIQAQDIIVDLAESTGRTVVVNNSWGFVECEGLCGHTVTEAVDAAAQHPSVIQVFAAGNQATGDLDCGQACDGSTIGINGPSSLDSVLSVAATGNNGDTTVMQPYSSRGGPGAVSCGTEKPDVSAPIFGTVPWGCESTDIGNSGGTSGAAPQVAGAVALIADAVPDASQADIFASIEENAEQVLGSGFSGCSGWGNLRADLAADVEPSTTVGAALTPNRAIAGLVVLGFAGALARRAMLN